MNSMHSMMWHLTPLSSILGMLYSFLQVVHTRYCLVFDLFWLMNHVISIIIGLQSKWCNQDSLWLCLLGESRSYFQLNSRISCSAWDSEGGWWCFAVMHHAVVCMVTPCHNVEHCGWLSCCTCGWQSSRRCARLIWGMFVLNISTSNTQDTLQMQESDAIEDSEHIHLAPVHDGKRIPHCA